MKEKLSFPIITIVFSLFFLSVSLLNPIESKAFIGPNGWPNIVLGFTLLMGIAQLIKITIEYRKNHFQQFDKVKTHQNSEKKDLLLENRHWIVIGAIGLYVLLLPYVGFLILTVALYMFISWIFGMHKIKNLILSTVISNIAFLVVFSYLLKIPLPRGVGVFEMLSYFIY